MNYRNVHLNCVAALVLNLLGVALVYPRAQRDGRSRDRPRDKAIQSLRMARILRVHRGNGVSLLGWLLYGRWR